MHIFTLLSIMLMFCAYVVRSCFMLKNLVIVAIVQEAFCNDSGPLVYPDPFALVEQGSLQFAPDTGAAVFIGAGSAHLHAAIIWS